MKAQDAYNIFCHKGRKKEPDLRSLSAQQQKIYNLAAVGWDKNQIAGRLDISVNSVNDALRKIRHWGYDV